MVNVACSNESCGYRREMICEADATIVCPQCGFLVVQLWWERGASRPAQWSEKDAIVVFQKPDGSISYPARNDKPTPPGHTRIEMRSIHDVHRFEREHKVINESMWYDKGKGGYDPQHTPRISPRRDTFSE